MGTMSISAVTTNSFDVNAVADSADPSRSIKWYWGIGVYNLTDSVVCDGVHSAWTSHATALSPGNYQIKCEFYISGTLADTTFATQVVGPAMTSFFTDWSNQTSGYGTFAYNTYTTSVTLNITGPGTPSIINVNVPGGSCSYATLNPGSTYNCSATANPGGNTLNSSFTTPAPAPAVPADVTGVNATGHDGYVHVTWNPASGATSYDIYYGKTGAVSDTIATGITGTSSDVFVANGFQYYFKMLGANATGRSAAFSNIAYATPGPGRPSNFTWAYTTVTAGGNCLVDRRDWNFLTDRINMFRAYKLLSAYAFTTVTAEAFQALYYRQAVTAISDMSPPTAVPPLHYVGDVISASNIDQLRLSLNSIP